ncbi:MAG: ATP-binding protein [Opitutaceae bacterium]|jgi:hypothetical protein
MMTHEQRLREQCRKLRPIMGAKADALWLAYATSETPKTRQEAESLIHMMTIRHLGGRVDGQAILLPPPRLEQCVGEFALGAAQYAGKAHAQVCLTRENLTKHMGIFSITGGGKTNIGINLLLQLQQARIPFMVVDWKRSYRHVRSIQKTGTDDLVVLSVGRDGPTAFLWNPLRGPPGVHAQTWLSVVAEVLEKSHLSGPGVADILMELFDRQYEAAGVYDGTVTEWPNFHDVFRSLNRQQFRGRRLLWRDSCSRILRTFTFGPCERSFNARDPLALETLLQKQVILELDQELPKPLRVFFTELIVRWLHLYRLGEGESAALRHVLLLEEVHNLFPKVYGDAQATHGLESVVREIRSFGQGLVFISQHPSLMPVYVIGNCNTLIFLGLSHEADIRAAKQALFLSDDEVVYLDRLQVGEGIVKIKGRVNACFVKFPLAPTGGD